jgi:quercetin dioxygenase-like cupin family protein
MERHDLLQLSAPGGVTDPLVLVDDDGARALLLVLEADQELGDHQTRENCWMVVVEGTFEVGDNGARHTVGVGGFLRWPRDERRTVRTTTGGRMLMVLAPWPADDHFLDGEPPR